MGFFFLSMAKYNDNRNEEAFLEMRPELFLEHSSADTKIEQFQNETLRPILKLQHNLLVDLFLMQPNVDAVLSYKSKRTVFLERIRIFTQQPILKGMLLGVVMGCFTQEELQTYREHTKEYNRRIQDMLMQRFADALA